MGKFILYIFILTAAFLSAQEFPDLKFGKITMRDGLGSDDIRCLFQDSRGIIWVGTEGGGLNRLSSTGIKIYKHKSDDASSIPSNTINDIVEDRQGLLWVATANGLAHFDPYSGKSKNIHPKSEAANSQASTWVASLLILDSGEMLISADDGVKIYDLNSKKITDFKLPEYGNPKYNEGYAGFGLIKKDRQNRYWVMHKLGVHEINLRDKTLTFYDKKDEIPLTSLYQNKKNEYFVSYWPGGVKKFRPDQGSYEVHLAQTQKFGSTIAGSMTEWTDNAGNTWFCMGFAEVFVLQNPVTGEMKEYYFDKKNDFSYNVNLVSEMLIDRQNRLWLAADNGLHIIDPALQNFSNIPLYQQLNMERPTDFGVPSGLFKTQDNYYFPVWFSRGIYKADKNWKIEKLNTDALFKSHLNVNHQRINSFYIDPEQTAWYATDSGLVRQKGKEIKLFSVPGAKNYETLEFVIHNICPAADGTLWMRCRVSGILVFDPKQEKFVKYFKRGTSGLSDDIVTGLFIDSEQQVWVGNAKHIYRYDSVEDRFNQIKVKDRQGRDLAFPYPAGMTESRDGQFIWVATRANGLIQINKKDNSAVNINETDGLYENSLYRVLVDTADILWITSENGLNRYDVNKKRFSFFNYQSGLPYLFGNWGILDFDFDGNIVMGNNGTITRFNPYTLKQSLDVPDVVLLDVSANGESIPARDRFELKAGVNSFLLNFAITSYTASQLNKYYYRLDEAENWTMVEEGSVFFGRMPHGDYLLHLKGMNHEGIESHIKSISIHIRPFWWETNWFKGLILLILASIAFAFVKFRIRNIRKEAALKHQLSETEMKALRSQMNPHFIFNCLNSIELYTAQNNSQAAGYYLSRFSRLIRLVLDNSKTDTIPLSQELETLKLYLELEKMRFKDKLNFTITVAENIESEFIEIPSMLIQPYVENAIWHGIMHKPEGGNIHVDVQLDEPNHLLLIRVKDDGIGRKMAAELKSKSAISHKSYGMKISDDRMKILNEKYGLKAQVEVLDLHNENNQPTGTQVNIRIPV